jgi:electron transfer flavoprotein beta subunit
MKILVTLKRVVDPYAKGAPSSDGASLDTGGLKFEINPFDEIAMEAAVQIREKFGADQIVVVSIGPSPTEDQLRKALAMGADKAILIESDREWDSLSIAKELAALLGSEPFDLVLMGKQATDDDCNQTGQMLAALLGWPQATFASKIEIAGGGSLVTRETDTGEQTLRVTLPAVITADLRLNQPRYIALPGIIKARSKPLEKRAPSTVPTLKVKSVHFEASPKRAPGKIFASSAELAEAIFATGALA